MLGDDPPYLSVGTEVSAKYKGAFCEAKIRKVVRSVKCRVTYKQGLGTATVTDDQIKGTLRVGASVEARHNDKKDFVEATITKIQDCSQYTVVFDDGDITTLRRTALCLKSGRHFAESETLDQLPLTHPEHFGNPVIGGRRGRRSRQTQDDSSDDEDDGARGSNDSGSGSGSKEGPETEPEIGRVVCVELGDKKKKDNWFPGLVVAPTAQDTVRIRVRDDYLVRSFKDARYYTVPKKEATEFTKDLVNKVENSALKVAVEKALLFLEKNELPPHWDRDSLFGNTVSTDNSDSEGELDSDSSDDEPREEKDHFVAQLYKFMDDRGTPINNCPMIGNEDIDLYRLFRAVYKIGGYNRVTNQNQWKLITRRLNFSMQNNSSTHNLVKQAYKKFLHSFEDFYRKLGCTMVNHPRGSTRKQRPGRSLIRDKDRNTPVPTQDKSVKNEKEDEEKEKKPSTSTAAADEEVKKEKREVKKEPVVKEEESLVKVKRKEEPAEESASGQDSDVNVEGEESSSSEKSQKSTSRLTPSNVGAKSKATAALTAKTKEEPVKKKPPQEKKRPEVKKQEKKDEKSKEDDSTKTRSKSKEDIMKANKPNSDTRETRAPSRESDKKAFAKQRRMTEEELKKRGRKKKETEGEKGRAPEDRSVEYAPSYKGPVEIGDRLKVYYGPTHESKVTYEAKVIDMEKDGTEAVYLVHYTGWNTRYDEWIKTSRIAQNFTQAQGRVKRTKATPRPQTPGASSSSSKSKSATAPNAGTGASSTASGAQSRRRAQSVAPTSGASNNKDARKEDREGTPATRSTTPSPLTSCISRTKSPATTANSRPTRTTRNADSALANDMSRRTRRTSGHTDAMAAEESESEDTDSMDSDVSAEPETTQIQSRSRRGGGPPDRNRREARRRAESRMKMEETSDGETEKDVEEPRRGRRLRKVIGKLHEVKSEPESDEEQPKGRDFDLNQIRSELKGFDKAVKLEIACVEPDPEDEEEERPPAPIKLEKDESDNLPEKKQTIPDPEKKREPPKVEPQTATPIKREPIKVEANSESTEDIYEFKEPEPFEFEVRNKRDSGGSTGSNTDKEKEKEKDKEKAKKRVFEEDLKSPKKRQKTFNATNVQAKAEPKTEGSPNENTDSKKKPRKMFKKSDDITEEADTEGEDIASTSRDLSKFYSANYSGMAFKRRGAFGASNRGVDENFTDDTNEIATEDKDKLKKTVSEEDKSPKKRQTKAFTGSTTPKPNETKVVETSVLESVDNKKKVRKMFWKGANDDNDEPDETSKDSVKFYSNYSGPKVLTGKQMETDEAVDNSVSESKEKPKKTGEEDTVKNSKKRQKTLASATPKTEANTNENPDVKKKITRRPAAKKAEEINDDESGSDGADETITTRDHVKYYSHYSGPKAKAASITNDENVSDRLAAKLDAQVSETAKVLQHSANIPQTPNKEDNKPKSGEPTASTSSLIDAKQGISVADKKRISEVASSNKIETKPEMKPLDFTPIVPHSLPVPAPISARLPATASIEEKLSAAAVFRSKLKDTKKDDDSDSMTRKILIKETMKKSEAAIAKKVREKDESKIKHEPEKKKPQLMEPVIVKKDPLQEIELRKDPLLEVIKKKEEEMSKTKKEADMKPNIVAATTPVTKTYGNQKKEQVTKIEETWKKAAVATTMAASRNEEVTVAVSGSDADKDYMNVRKETIVSKIKSSIDRDSVDSTDSSDSERRLTIIDSEDFPDDKCNESGSENKTKSSLPSTSAGGSYNNITQPEHATVLTIHGEVSQQIGVPSVISTIIQAKSSKMEEDGENLNSLLCEEEIPGSPTPGSETLDQEHRTTSSQNLLKSDLGSKVAVAFVAAQLPLSTVATSAQLTKCAMVTTMSSGLTGTQSTNSLVAVSMVQHSSMQSIQRPQSQSQPQPQSQPQQQQQLQPQPQPQQQQQQQQQQHQLHQQPQPQLQPQPKPQPQPQLQLQPQPQPQPQPSVQIQHQHQHQQQQPLQQQQHHQQQQQQQFQQHQQQQQQQHQQQPQQQQQQQQQPRHHHEHAVPIPVPTHRRESNEADPVMDNTPPTTPDSIISNISGSPRDERLGGSTPSSSEDNSKLNRDSSEAENDSGGKGSAPGYSEDDGSLVNSEHGGNGGATSSSSDRIPKPPAKRSLADADGVTPKKRKKRKDQDTSSTNQSIASGKKSPRQSTRNTRHGTGSDSDTSEGSNQCINNSTQGAGNRTPMISSATSGSATNNMPVPGMTNTNGDIGNYSNRSPRPTKYNFFIDIDPDLDGSQRISVLQQRLSELRKTYNSVKVELAGIERRRKKLKRREREAQKAAKAEMQQACS